VRTTSKTIVVMSLLLAAGLATPAIAQGVSEATGKVVDREGNPVQGAMISFAAQSKPDVTYEGKSNKKGRYYIPGLFTGKAQEMWIMTIEAEGYLPVSVYAESRTVNKVLIGDPITSDLSKGKRPPQMPIPPLGKATVNWTMGPREEIERERQDLAEAQAVARAAEAGTGDGADAAREKDPWAEALMLVSSGDLEGSLEPFGKAIEKAPEGEEAERRESYAKVLYQLERNDEAEAEARRTLELDPTRKDAHMLLYSIYEAEGDDAAVRSTLEAASEALPPNTRILERLAFVSHQQGDDEAAIVAYTRITELDPKNAEAWMALGNIHGAAGRFEESEAAFEKLSSLDSKNPHLTFYNLGALIMKRDDAAPADIERAISAFRKAVELKPDYGRAYKELGAALLMTGDRAGALEAYRSYVKVDPSGAGAQGVPPLIGALEKSLGL